MKYQLQFRCFYSTNINSTIILLIYLNAALNRCIPNCIINEHAKKNYQQTRYCIIRNTITNTKLTYKTPLPRGVSAKKKFETIVEIWVLYKRDIYNRNTWHTYTVLVFKVIDIPLFFKLVKVIRKLGISHNYDHVRYFLSV